MPSITHLADSCNSPPGNPSHQLTNEALSRSSARANAGRARTCLPLNIRGPPSSPSHASSLLRLPALQGRASNVRRGELQVRNEASIAHSPVGNQASYGARGSYAPSQLASLQHRCFDGRAPLDIHEHFHNATHLHKLCWPGLLRAPCSPGSTCNSQHRAHS